MSEQSAQPNSQEQETPKEHESAIEDRILSLLDPAEDKPEEAKPEEEVKAEEPAESETEDSKEQTEVKEEDEPVPEVEDVEYEGKSYKVPKELKEALLRQSDYTRKTQELAERSKSAETLLQQAKELAELQRASQKQLGQLASLEEQIEQYEKVDWNTLTASDATRAQQLFIAFQQAKDSKAKLEAELGQIQSKQAEAAHKARQAKIEEGMKVLSKDIKGWSAELGQKIMASSESYGFTKQELSQIIDPRVVKALHDAHQWRTLQASKPAVEKKAAAKVQTLKPQGGEQRNAAQQSYDKDRQMLKSAKNPTDQAKAAERLILRKLG